MLSRKQKGFTAMPTMPVANKLRFMGDEISRRGCLVDRCAQRGRGANVSSGHLDTWEYGMDFVCGHRWRNVYRIYTYLPEEKKDVPRDVSPACLWIIGLWQPLTLSLYLFSFKCVYFHLKSFI